MSQLSNTFNRIRQQYHNQGKIIVIEDVGGLNHKLQEWENFYNYHRPHGAFKGKSPYEQLRDKFDLPG